ncbi:MAG: hypothetical protein CM1200mP36_11460 [Gammaproteobacteria bacterium]|nr:MAG: hypothetical protein CM1200mP36_11460 [Gammaproteobacteria bacterium]
MEAARQTALSTPNDSRKNKTSPGVVEEFLSFEGPAFLEVIIDPEANVYPMVPPGTSYRDMLTGDFIPNRYEDRRPRNRMHQSYSESTPR